MNRVIVTGAGGFIGHHLVKRLRDEENLVIGVDIKMPDFEDTAADSFELTDLRDPRNFRRMLRRYAPVDDVYHLAADMGGIGYIGKSRFGVASGNALIDASVLESSQYANVKRFFYSSSACIYPMDLQDVSGADVELFEGDAWPARPEPGYGVEKLFMEELCAYASQESRIKTHVARFHNVYGPLGTYYGGKEKVPAAICRKVALATNPGTIEVWGDGSQRRSFTYIDDCIEGIRRIMDSDYGKPLNLGSDEAVTICELVELVAQIAGKEIKQQYVGDRPTGVHNRNSNNDLIKQVLGWAPSISLEDGLKKTYEWIDSQVLVESKL